MRLDSAFENRGRDRFPKLDMQIVLDILGRRAEVGVASKDARMFDRGVRRKLGSGALGAAGSAPPAQSSGAADQAAKAEASSLPTEAQAYLACVHRATDQAALDGCRGLLP